MMDTIWFTSCENCGKMFRAELLHTNRECVDDDGHHFCTGMCKEQYHNLSPEGYVDGETRKLR